MLGHPVCLRSLKNVHCAPVGEAKTADNPTNPSNFCPITLASCISKVFTSLVKKRWLLHMVNNHFLNTATKKAFSNGVLGCSEHHLKLCQSFRGLLET